MRIYLIGFMGSGKTHWGRIWSATYQVPFYDLDELITEAEGLSVEDIFEKKGEDYFRMKETMALHSTLGYEHAIIACGGGAACFNQNIQWMNLHGITVYLSAHAQYLLDNIMDEQHKRPLLKKINPAELLFFIQQKLSERLPFYQQANLTLHAESLDGNSLDILLKTGTNDHA